MSDLGREKLQQQTNALSEEDKKVVLQAISTDLIINELYRRFLVQERIISDCKGVLNV